MKIYLRVALVENKIVIQGKNGPILVEKTGPLSIVGRSLCLRAELVEDKEEWQIVRLPEGKVVWVLSEEVREVAAA